MMVTTTLLALIVCLNSCYAELFTFSYNNNSHTKVMKNYKILRNNCEWIKRNSIIEKSTDHTLNPAKDVEDCIINDVTFDEGDGIIQITRFGPYLMTGKPDTAISHGIKLRAPMNGLIKFVIAAPIDPETGLLFGYPPFHIHHIFTNIPFKPSEFQEEFNIIPYLSRALKREENFFPQLSADAQCLEKKGDSDCLMRYLPNGYGMLPHGINRDSFISYHIEDLRKENSIPTFMYLEYAEGILTNSKSKQKIKPTYDCFMIARGKEIRQTYKLLAKQEMYMYETFYVPTDSKYVMNDIHGHYANGDEVWIIRGTQDDLNIPLKYRKKPITNADTGDYTFSAPIKVEGMTISELKQSFEANIKLKQKMKLLLFPDRYKNSKTTSKLDEYEDIISKTKKTSINMMNNRKNIMIPYSNQSLSMQTQLPEILCKLYAVTEYVDQHFINKMKSKHQGATNYLNSLSGIEEGSYYRRTLNSQDHAIELGKPQDVQYNQCHEYSIDAGHFLTIIQFNVARDIDYNQHNIYIPAVYMPALNISMFHGTY